MASSQHALMSQFQTTLRAMMSADNAVRGPAEKMYSEQRKTNPDLVASCLMTTVLESSDVQLQNYAPVLLRRVCVQQNWVCLSEQTRNGVLRGLLQALLDPKLQVKTKRLLSNCVSELSLVVLVNSNDDEDTAAGQSYTDSTSGAEVLNKEWPGMLATVMGMATTAGTDAVAAASREVGVDLLGRICSFHGEILKDKAMLQQFGMVLSNSLADANAAVRKCAMIALCSVLSSPDITMENGSADLAAFQGLFGPMLKVLEASLLSNEEDDATRELEALVELASNEKAVFFRPVLGQLRAAMLSIASSTNFAEDTRKMSMEVLISVAEASGGMARKDAELVSGAFQVAVSFLCEREDIDDAESARAWAMEPENEHQYDDSTEDEELAVYGSGVTDRLGRAIGPRALLPVALPVIESLLGSDEWKKRKAALCALEMIGEGCKSGMQKNIGNIFTMVVRFLRDPHPRVRYAAIHCIAQLAEDFRETMNDHCALILPPLMEVFAQAGGKPGGDAALTSLYAEWPRLLDLSANAMINVLSPNNLQPQKLLPFAEPLLRQAFDAINIGNVKAVAAQQAAVASGASGDQVKKAQVPFRRLQESALVLCTMVAAVVKKDFIRFYDTFMPLCKQIMKTAQGAEFSMLRARAMECVGIIASSVGKARFLPDAKEILDLLLAADLKASAVAQASGSGAAAAAAAAAAAQDTLSDGVSQSEYIRGACARIAKCLKRDFLPYMPVVLPPLIAQARESDLDKPTMMEPEGAEEYVRLHGGNDGSLVQKHMIEIPGIGMKTIVIHTSHLEEKHAAVQTLYQYIHELGPHFLPYAAETAAVLLPLTAFSQQNQIRAIAMCALAPLLTNVMEALRAQAGVKFGGGVQGTAASNAAALSTGHFSSAQELFENIVVRLLAQISAEREVEDALLAAEALAATLKAARESGGKKTDAEMAAQLRAECTSASQSLHDEFNPSVVGLAGDSLNKVVEALKGLMEESNDRRTEAAFEAQKDLDFDETSMEQLTAAMSNESDMLDYCMTCVGFLVTGARAGIVSAYREHLAPLVISYLRPGEVEPAILKVGVCMADDVLEWCIDAAPAGVGAGAVAAAAAAGTPLERLAATGLLSFPGVTSKEQGLQRLCEVFCQGAQSGSPVLGQCSIYGLGVLAQHGGETFANSPWGARTAAQVCLACSAQFPSSSQDEAAAEMRPATDNAVSALLKLLLFTPQSLPVPASQLFAQIAQTQLPMLDEGGDRLEQRVAHNKIVCLLEYMLPASRHATQQASAACGVTGRPAPGLEATAKAMSGIYSLVGVEGCGPQQLAATMDLLGKLLLSASERLEEEKRVKAMVAAAAGQGITTSASEEGDEEEEDLMESESIEELTRLRIVELMRQVLSTQEGQAAAAAMTAQVQEAIRTQLP